MAGSAADGGVVFLAPDGDGPDGPDGDEITTGGPCPRAGSLRRTRLTTAAGVLVAAAVVVGGRTVSFGSYRYQSSTAWPVGRGRWVCLSGFLGTGNGTDPRIARAQEFALAALVTVR